MSHINTLIQLRVEKSFADQLNALADRKQVPLSVMLRTWMAEKLRAEGKAELAERTDWIADRIGKLKLDDFEEGPLLVMHAFPLSGNAKLGMETLKQHSYLLLPGYGHRRYTRTEIVQHGLETVVRAGGEDEKIVASGKAFKTGQLEAILSISSEKKQFFGKHMDLIIATGVQSLCSLYRQSEVETGYVIRISLLNAKDYEPVTSIPTYSSHPLPRFNSNKIDLPEIVVTSSDQLASLAYTGEFLMEAIDELWHATGQEGSPSFDHNNKWVNEVR
jgi:hypothetical protein